MRGAVSILVVEDDPDIRELVADYLAGQGYAVRAAENGAEARAALQDALPDLVVLDLGLPDEDGLGIARHLREQHDLAIIMISGANEPIDRIVGLEVGSDDYLTKPFDMRELRARIKNVLRRYQIARAERPATAASARIRVGRAEFDVETRQLFDSGGEEVPLTLSEYELLKVFVDRPRRPLSRDQIMSLTRNRDCEPFDRSIDICVARLRRKIEADPARPEHIKTVRGVGYMFIPPPR
jgi:DNA-binding response OmpR family regulator